MFSCDNCGYLNEWCRDEVCVQCGIRKFPLYEKIFTTYIHFGKFQGWTSVIAKYSFKGQWYNPFSWLKYGYITKDDD